MLLLRLLACSALDALEDPVDRDCETRSLWYSQDDSAVRLDCEQPAGYTADSG